MRKTKTKLRNLILYQVFVRNFSEAGTFNAVTDDLDRIKELGVDVVYLLPIHPIGEAGKKGSLGCPYAIKDYREVNPRLGSLDDFKNLIAEVHKRGMKLMIDVVYNHTSRDSRLLKEHPEWFYHNEKGEISTKVPDWSDVYDLDYSSDKLLWEELIDTLVYWARLGVDGFRCDVASMVPIEFWQKARRAVNKVKRSFIWLSESVHGEFVKAMRDEGFECASESEVYEAFDMAYDYDVHPLFEDYFKGERPLKDYLEAIMRQDGIYPANYVKMKNLENHDQVRIAKWVDNDIMKIKNWLGFSFMQKGAQMIYAGEEYASDVRPSLFEKDVFNRNGDLTEFIQKLTKIKKRKIFADGIYQVHIPELDGVAYNTFEDDKVKYHGIFNVGGAEGDIEVGLADGRYRNYLNGRIVTVADGHMNLPKYPVIIKTRKH